MKKIISIILALMFSLLFVGCDACGIDGIQDDTPATQAEFVEFFKGKDFSFVNGNFSFKMDLKHESKYTEEKKPGEIVTTSESTSITGTYNFKNLYLLSAKTRMKYEHNEERVKGNVKEETSRYISESAIGTVLVVEVKQGVFGRDEVWYYDRYTKLEENSVSKKSTVKTDELTKVEGDYSRDILEYFPATAKNVLSIIRDVSEGYPSGSNIYFFIDGDDCMLVEANNSSIQKTALIYSGKTLKKICVYFEDGFRLIEITYEFCDYKEINAPSNASDYTD